MKVLGISGGTESGRSELARRLADRLGGGGRVGVVFADAATDSEGVADGDADVTYRLDARGGWIASGSDLSLDGALDR